MGIRTRRARKHANTHAVPFGIAGVLGFIALLSLALVVSLGGVVNKWLEDLPDYNNADAYLAAEPTTVYDAQGNAIVSFYLQQRRSVDLDQISPYVQKGTVDTEDVRFYQHNGVDPVGILRAVVVQVKGGSEGASTITQQLVRNTVLSDEQFEISLKRKVREAYIAIQLEKMFTKDQILNMYLNTIYYGNSVYGIEAASIKYFNKSAKDLTLAESALLVGIPNSPTAYDPIANPEAAIQRRNVVLDRMLTAGDITQEEHDAAQAEGLNLQEGTLSTADSKYPYFTDYVKSLLMEDFDSDTIFQGGLQVYTTIDENVQKAAEDAANRRLREFGNPDGLATSIVAIDNSNGYVVAMVGGQDYSASQFNLATQQYRQMGSSFKVFTLAAAISEGMNPNIMINNASPMNITPTYRLQNYANHNYGVRSLRSTTAISANTGYAQVQQAIGTDKVIAMARAMGVTANLPSIPSLTLGPVGMPPLEAAAAYSTLPMGGQHRDPVAITKITDRYGNTIYEHKDNPTQAMKSAVAANVTDILQDVLTVGTAASSHRLITFNQPVAGKTGTTDEAQDLWMIGYTPQYTAAVWMGYPAGLIPVSYGGYSAEGTVVPEFIYFMNAALDGVAREEFPKATDTIDFKPNSSWHFVGTSANLNAEKKTQTKTQTTTETSTTTNATTESSQTSNSSSSNSNNSSTNTGTGGNNGGSNGGSNSGSNTGTNTGGNTGNQGGTNSGGTGGTTSVTPNRGN